MLAQYGYQRYGEWRDGVLFLNPASFDINAGAGAVVSFWGVGENVSESDIRSALGPPEEIDPESFIRDLGEPIEAKKLSTPPSPDTVSACHSCPLL